MKVQRYKLEPITLKKTREIVCLEVKYDNPIAIPSTGSKDEKIAVMVQECANNFAKGISQAPQDWHMLQRIWVDEDFMERKDA